MPQVRRSLSTAQCLNAIAEPQKNTQAGVPKPTRNQSKPLTYEETQKPSNIAVTKAYNSWNSSNLEDYRRTMAARHAWEDMLIRKFMMGVWPSMIYSDREIIIKRQCNQVRVSCYFVPLMIPRKLYFLIGFSEEALSYILKCPVKLELQTLVDKRDKIFRYW